MSATIQETIDELRRTLHDYIEATYHIAHPAVIEQRRRLLETVGGIFQTPYLESTPRYVTGQSWADMARLPAAVREAFIGLSQERGGHRVIFDPPYSHQAQAVEATLADGRNLMIMTGTGSGKTESFLLPILGKLVMEASRAPDAFQAHSAVRAMVLYPMNALVNDQLGRLRLLFGDPGVVALFEGLAGRPARFARYTSRTPYAGVRSPRKDGSRLASIGDFFVEIERARDRDARGEPRIAHEDAKAGRLFEQLAGRGKWPAKESVAAWFGQSGGVWRRGNDYVRGVMREHDAELMTRHEVQATAPDLLITNYSMLEYMMMRPIERPIFDQTRAWLRECPEERFLIVLDEAHLYRGAQGAEVGLLLRRLRERLDIPAERFQVICATASFSEAGRRNAGTFGAELSGAEADTFEPITGNFDLRTPAARGTAADIDALCAVDIERFYADDRAEQLAAVAPFLAYRHVANATDVGTRLHAALREYAPFNRLVNESMQAAIALDELGPLIFDNADVARADAAITALLAMGSRARLGEDQPSLLPCRVHSFFRGLPGLWACMDPACSELEDDAVRGGPIGRLYAQPRERCGCGAPVLSYYTCRHCGTSYAQAYTNDPTNPRNIWAEPGERLITDSGEFEKLQKLDLLLEEPSRQDRGVAATYDLVTGLLDPASPNQRQRIVYLSPRAGALLDADNNPAVAGPGEFAPCACCGRAHRFGQSSIQDHQTKGDQPFQALLSTQISVQPPSPQLQSEFAPLRGRKVLIFSDSRQMAARLAPRIQEYSLRDTIRSLIPTGFQMLGLDPMFGPGLILDHAFIALIVAAHRFGVRVRPELDPGEVMPIITSVPRGAVPTGMQLVTLLNESPPANLTSAIFGALTDGQLGLEPLAVASIRESNALTAQIDQLPPIPGLADDAAGKRAVVRAWLRCWSRGPGFWMQTMPPSWWATKINAHNGSFAPMDRVLTSAPAKRVFSREWLVRLMPWFARQMPEGGFRLLGSNLALEIGGDWRRCSACTSVHRPIPNLATCIDCGAAAVNDFDPDHDEVFQARRGFYRQPVIDALTLEDPGLVSLIAAEHTAQLNAAQPDEAFSRAERHEMRFQDIDIAWRDTDPLDSAIDVLSSTTKMEVGIDIGALSGVALRNMPPGRANYQQRAGRAGRRGNAVATVIAFGSADSHDDHYFVAPAEMIRGPVVDPRLTLENRDIARRHLRAFLLQRYHEARIQTVDATADANLFSVLGSVQDFRDGNGILNRRDFGAWLIENEDALRASAERWLPDQLSASDRADLIDNMIADVRAAIDDATAFVEAPEEPEPVPGGEWSEDDNSGDDEPEIIDDAQPQDTEGTDPSDDRLLNRLLYWGKLPRYAFPTDVAPFYIFNAALSTPYRPKMDFAPSQGLNIALSQYAPNKQIWINNKQYTSKAIYSPYRDERRNAWRARRLYLECSRCGHAKTEEFVPEARNVSRDCEACHATGTFGPGRPWMRPPGFAHPIDRAPVTTPDQPNETAYATRAKLIMQTPGPETGWVGIGERIRAFPTRERLLVTNPGPGSEGYHYCTACGAIEAARDPEDNLFQPHDRPYRSSETEPCSGTATASRIVLGTDFLTDIVLLSLPLDGPFRLTPGNDETASAMRTICEALAKAACRLLQVESGEILAEYRPALTDQGAAGAEVEIFLYDTLAGGAGFTPQLAALGHALIERALDFLSDCPEGCDSSCYRCLRSFRNKLDHSLLDRKLGEQVLRHARDGGLPDYNTDRAERSLDILFTDLSRQLDGVAQVERGAERAVEGNVIQIPLIVRRGQLELWVDLASPAAATTPVHEELQSLTGTDRAQLICVSDLIVRRNLPAAIGLILAGLA